LRRSDSLEERKISHVLSMVGFNVSQLKNFKDEPWSAYGQAYKHLVIDIDDVDDENMLIELPRAVMFIREGLNAGSSQSASDQDDDSRTQEGELGAGVDQLKLDSGDGKAAVVEGKGGVFVHCAAGKSRSVAVTIAYLLWRYPNRFDPNIVPLPISDPANATEPPSKERRSRRETAGEAVQAALAFVRRTRPMAEPNDGFMEQLRLWWEMGCPVDKNIEEEVIYQRWAYKREVEANVAVGQAPSRLRFEDEEASGQARDTSGLSLRCKKCRRTLVTSQFIASHNPASGSGSKCQHFFIEPLSWMRNELENGALSGRLLCPNERCGAGVGRYDWKGFKCSCDGWVTPAFSLQKARVDDVAVRPIPRLGDKESLKSMGIRFPPGARGGSGNL
jgi:dual specificity phosphatase 12